MSDNKNTKNGGTVAAKDKTNKYEHPGRPRYQTVYPEALTWTFKDLMKANGVETNPDSENYGRGPRCTLLTLRKGIEADRFFHREGAPLTEANRTGPNPDSVVCVVEGMTADPDSARGLGRRAVVFCLRVNLGKVNTAAKAAAKPAAKAAAKPVAKGANPAAKAAKPAAKGAKAAKPAAKGAKAAKPAAKGAKAGGRPSSKSGASLTVPVVSVVSKDKVAEPKVAAQPVLAK